MMRVRFIGAISMIGACGLSACGGIRKEPPRRGIAEDVFRAEYASKACEQVARFCAPLGVAINIDSCLAAHQEALASWIQSEVPRQYDPDAAARCFDALEQPLDPYLGDPCWAVYVGQRALGEACKAKAD